jgi:hypothetical protein
MMSSKTEDRNASAPPSVDENQSQLDILVSDEEKRPLDKRLLANILRNPMRVLTQPMRDQTADHLEGKIKRKRGRPRDETPERLVWELRVMILYASILPEMRKLPRTKRRCTPTKAALQETVKRLATNKKYMSIGTVKRIVQGARTRSKVSQLIHRFIGVRNPQI